MTRAIVIGASIGGLLTARVLADHVDEVIVIDRDTPPSEPENRRGVGQAGQAHLLLDSGRQAMERLLPGLFEEVRVAGGQQADVGHMCWYHSGHYKVRADTGLSLAIQSRPFLEHHIRRRVAMIAGVELRYGVSCRGLEASEGRIRSVQIEDAEGASSTLAADFVIVACGRGAQALRWMEALGVAPPPTREIKINIGYASRYYEGMPEPCEQFPTMITYGVRKRSKRHALAFRVEHGRVLLTAMGYHGEHPARDEASFHEWFDTLDTLDIAGNLAQATPVSEVMSFRTPVQYRRHWQRVALPEGLVLVGDAVCGLDPTFGQGMSVVAVQAAGLAELLARGPFDTKQIQRMVARKTSRPWLITSIEAARYKESAGDVRVPLVRVFQRFLDRVYRVSAYDPVVYRAFLDVIFLNRAATWLMRPSILARLARPRPKQRPTPGAQTAVSASQRAA